MDTKHLITFITFSEEKSYLRASMKLNYAASTLSEHILSLENELGVKLVESKGKRTVLTKGGEKFLVYAKKMMEVYNTACKDMSSMNAIKGNLRVMTVESLGLYSMATVFTKFMTKYPDVTLSISIGNCNIIYDRLRSDEIDVAYLYDMKPVKMDDMETTVLFREPLCFVVSPGHYLAKKDVVTPKDFQHQVFILAQKDCYYYKQFEKLLKENRITLNKIMHLDSGNLIKKYVRSGYGITILPYSVVREDVREENLKILNWTGESWEAYAQILTLKKEWIMPSIPALTRLSRESAIAFSDFP